MNRMHNPRMTFEIKIQRQLNKWLWSVTITQILQTINGILQEEKPAQKENFTGDTALFSGKRMFSKRYTCEGKNFHLG